MCSFVIFAILFTSIRCDSHLLVDQLRHDFLTVEETFWEFLLSEAPTINQEEAQVQLIQNFSVFDQKLQQMPEDILRGLEPVKNTKVFIFINAELNNTETMYTKFRNFQEEKTGDGNQKISETIQLDDIVRNILDPETGANASINKMYNLILEKENIVAEVSEILDNDFQCKNFFQSPQLVLYNLYNSIALNYLKNYIMLQFAYLERRIGEEGNYTELSNEARRNFETKVNKTMLVFRKTMEISNLTTWRCDPEQHKKDITYVEITRLLEGHIENEVDMNAEGTCTKTCDSYTSSTSHGCFESDSSYCRETERCTGNITECQFVEGYMSICPSKSPLRRYDYVEYSSGRTMGQKSSCVLKRANSWSRGFVKCSYCLCLCDAQGPKSDRYINMRPVSADTDNNMVITGVRFVKRNRIIHLQIQEGKILPYGYIDNTTVHWVPVDDYKIDDPWVNEGIDYFTLTYEHRSLALDNLVVPAFADEQIVTGLRFVFHKMLRLQYTTTSIEWKDGSFIEYSTIIRSYPARGNNQIDLSKADIPSLAPSTDVIYTRDPYINFTHTDFDADAAQTTIPFIDIQPVYNDPPVPLRGVGLHLRGKAGYGGFIAPKLFNYDYAFLMRNEFSKEEMENEGKEKSIRIIFLK